MAKTQISTYINHVALVLDGSGSMYTIESQLVKVADQQIQALARTSQQLDQETRVTVYSFRDHTVDCLCYDKDVLRLPSLRGFYQAQGQTPLVDATIKAIDDLEKTAQLYGDHAFLVYVLTDGQENSSKARSYDLANKVSSLPDNWTLAGFVPNILGKNAAKQYGFPADNLMIWDATAKGIEEVGRTIERTTENYMRSRATGVRSSKNLFNLNPSLSKSQVSTAGLKRFGPGQFRLLKVQADQPIAEFVETQTRRPYLLGEGFYQLTKPVEIQPQKNVAIYEKKGHSVYVGQDARTLLGLPDYTVKVNPSSYPDFEVFIQSTSVNRKLFAGTSLLLLTPGTV